MNRKKRKKILKKNGYNKYTQKYVHNVQTKHVHAAQLAHQKGKRPKQDKQHARDNKPT